MNGEYGYTSYLRSKRTVDDRALNKDVLAALRSAMPTHPVRIMELGGGLGTMVRRLFELELAPRATYVLVDVDETLLRDARRWLSQWSAEAGIAADDDHGVLVLEKPGTSWRIEFEQAEVGAFVERSSPTKSDLLIANAFLDLVEVPVVLPHLFRNLLAPGGLFWFGINFDGETIFEPPLPEDDAFMRVYHRSMDERVRYGRPAGDSKTGRHLFTHLRKLGAEVISAGASDWVVFANQAGAYPHEERLFLRHILDTVDQELQKHAEIDRARLAAWVRLRDEQLARGELVYLAHQLDFVGRAPR